MTQASNFTDILRRSPTEFERPKPFPIGLYAWQVMGAPRFDKSSKKQTPFAEFTLQCLEAREVADETAAAEFGPVVGKQMKATYYLTEEATFMLREFLANCGLDEAQYENLEQMIEDVPNCTILAYVTHEPSQDGQRMFARIGQTARAD